jgi:spore maturation protein CgeB
MVDVVVLGPDHPDSFAENIAVSLNALGITATVVDPSARFSRPGGFAQFRRSSRLLTEATHRVKPARTWLVDRPVDRALEELQPRLVISVWAYFEPAQLDRWRARTPAATWLLWFPDCLANLRSQSALVAGYDHLFFKDAYLVDLLSDRTDLPVHLLAEACNPARHRTELPRDAAEAAEYRCDVAIAGNMYPYRRMLLHQLPSGVGLRLYGNPPTGDRELMRSFTGRYVTGREKALAFGGAAIVLNTMHYAEIEGVNARLFEATGCGAFVLTHTSPALDRYFVPGEEIAAFDTTAELRDAVEHYLHDPDARRRIALAGQERAHRDHSYARRLEAMLAVCGRDDLLPALARSV